MNKLQILNDTKLQSTNNAQYQLLKELINIIETQQVTIDQLNSIVGINTTVDTASLVGKTMTFTLGKLTKFV